MPPTQSERDFCTYKCFQKRLCGCEEKKDSCAFRPWFSGGLWHFYVYQKEHLKIKRKDAIPMETANYNMMNLKKQLWNSGQHIPVSACWTNSWCSHVIGRTQNTVKHSGKYYFQSWPQWNSIASGNRRPLPLVILDDIGWHWMILDDSGTMRNLYHVSTKIIPQQTTLLESFQFYKIWQNRASFLWGTARNSFGLCGWLTNKPALSYIMYIYMYIIYIIISIYNYIYIQMNIHCML